MIIRLMGTVATVVTLSVTVGCGGEAPPPAPMVPRVESPRGLVGIDPCTLLDKTARTGLGFDSGVPGTDEFGANCRWTGVYAESAQLTAFTSGNGLRELAEDRDSTTSRVRLLGYPALETFTARGEFCRYDVGVAQDQAIVATMRSGRPDSCTALQELLTVVITRLPATD